MMERKPRKSLSLGSRINRRSASAALTDDTVINQEPTSPSVFANTTPCKSTPPHRTISLDESIEFSPSTFLNNSFSPNTLQTSQTFENSEVSWKWGQKVINEHVVSDAVLTDCRATAAETKNNKLPQRRKFLRDIESKMRKAENTRTDEMLKRRCAKFREKLMGDENLTPEKKFPNNLKEKNEIDMSTVKAAEDFGKSSPLNNINNPVNTIDDFFNDSDTDDFLLEATEQVEHDIIRLTQKPSLNTNISTTPKSAHNHGEKRSSLYNKFLEDDMSDDIFGNLDDIIENALKDTKPKSSFQRFNSLPVESNSPNSTRNKKSTKIAEISKNDSPNFKRHASCHDVPIYYPHKPKQARRT